MAQGGGHALRGSRRRVRDPAEGEPAVASHGEVVAAGSWNAEELARA